MLKNPLSQRDLRHFLSVFSFHFVSEQSVFMEGQAVILLCCIRFATCRISQSSFSLTNSSTLVSKFTMPIEIKNTIVQDGRLKSGVAKSGQGIPRNPHLYNGAIFFENIPCFTPLPHGGPVGHCKYSAVYVTFANLMAYFFSLIECVEHDKPLGTTLLRALFSSTPALSGTADLATELRVFRSVQEFRRLGSVERLQTVRLSELSQTWPFPARAGCLRKKLCRVSSSLK